MDNFVTFHRLNASSLFALLQVSATFGLEDLWTSINFHSIVKHMTGRIIQVLGQFSLLHFSSLQVAYLTY